MSDVWSMKYETLFNYWLVFAVSHLVGRIFAPSKNSSSEVSDGTGSFRCQLAGSLVRVVMVYIG